MVPVLQASLTIGLVIGLFIGFVLGYIVGRKSKSPDQAITLLQLFAVSSALIYSLISFSYGEPPSGFIFIGLLTLGYGAKGGELLEKALEKKQ